MTSFFSNQHIKIFWMFFAWISIMSCKKESIVEDGTTSTTNFDSDDTAVSLTGDLQVSDFVWQGLNNYYYWQEQVPELADSKLQDSKAYAAYISENKEPETFFYDLNHPDDRFSWIQDDYTELENLLQGVFATNGVEFGLTYACEGCEELIGFVKYILKGSNADGKNIKRGDFFIGVNGTTLTVNNYRSLLFGEELTYSLNLASVVSGTIQATEQSVELTKEENFESDPIQEFKVFSTSIGEVGYIMYNQFVADKSPRLNEVFGDFKSRGISNLILDLRYNGGGSIRNCIELSSMITGQFTDEIFAQEQWNTKVTNQFFKTDSQKENLINRFLKNLEDGTPINSLRLNRLFVITTSESASASELLINGLAPFIEIVQVGERTVGKNVGSITVYDYIDNLGTKNPDHTYAMQPIVLKIANRDGFADYSEGLEPTFQIDEDIRNMGMIGDEDEPLVAAVLDLINGTEKVSASKTLFNRSLLIQDPLLLSRQKMISDTKILAKLSQIKENDK